MFSRIFELEGGWGVVWGCACGGSRDARPGCEWKSAIFERNCSRLLVRLCVCPAGPFLRVYSGENG